MPSAQRSGLSATVGLVLVVGLLLVSGTLAVSGGGILSGGGRLGVDPVASPSAAPAVAAAASSAPAAVRDTGDSDAEQGASNEIGHSFDYTCDADVIRDINKAKWTLNRFLAGARDGFDRVTFELSRRRGKAKDATQVSIEWMEPRQARETFPVGKVPGQRALVVTFDGPVDITANQVLDALFLDREGVQSVRSIEMFEGEDGKVRTVVGIRGEGCVKMLGQGWKKKNNAAKAKIFLDVLVPDDSLQ